MATTQAPSPTKATPHANPPRKAGIERYQVYVMVLNPQPLPRTVAEAMTLIRLVWVIRTTRGHHRWPPDQDIHYWHDQDPAQAICEALNAERNPFSQAYRSAMAQARILNHARSSTKALV